MATAEEDRRLHEVNGHSNGQEIPMDVEAIGVFYEHYRVGHGPHSVAVMMALPKVFMTVLCVCCLCCRQLTVCVLRRQTLYL